MKENAWGDYEDMLDLPHHVSKRHPPMPLSARAAQFSPFAALAGYEDAIKETARQTGDFMELTESQKEQIDNRLRMLQSYQILGSGQDECQRHYQEPEITVTYFHPDRKKSGGEYRTIRGKMKKIDEYNHRILFADGRMVPMEFLVAVEGEVFENLNVIERTSGLC